MQALIPIVICWEAVALIAQFEQLDGVSAEELWCFEGITRDVLNGLVEGGRFNGKRPEDDVVHKLLEGSMDDLSDDELLIYNERIYPLLATKCWRPEQFDTEYERCGTPGYYDDALRDRRQLDLFNR